MKIEIDILLEYLQKREEAINETILKLKNGKATTGKEAELLKEYLQGKIDIIDEIKWRIKKYWSGE